MAKFIKISALSQPSCTAAYSGDMEGMVRIMEQHLRTNIAQVLVDDPDLIVLPEACDRFPSMTMEVRKDYYRYRGNRMRDMYREIARKHNCYIAYSACRLVEDEIDHPFRNSTQLIGRDGEIVGIYDKNHLVPDEYDKGEIAYGTEPIVLETDFGRVGFAICFDLNYYELMNAYADLHPDLIIFSSMYHGGLTQENWAYTCQSFFVGAICNDQSRILNPVGEQLYTTTNYQNYITGKVNLDYAVIHIDRNRAKYLAAKKKYGDKLIIHDPGHVGVVVLYYEGEDITARDIVREFDIMLLDDYFSLCREHKQKNQ